MSERNPDLVAVSATLLTLAAAIHAQKDETNDIDTYRSLNSELIEINHRITMIGGLIFRARTQAIMTAAARVEDGKVKVMTAIAEIEKVNTLIKTISSFLGLVDNVIDLAKKARLS